LLSLPQILLAGLSETQQQAALSGSLGALVLVWLQEHFHFKEGSHFFSTTDLFASQLPRSSNDRQYPLSLQSSQLFSLADPALENAIKTQKQTMTAAMDRGTRVCR
jgi:hypothetical protein